jgi:hypothetical protein
VVFGKISWRRAITESATTASRSLRSLLVVLVLLSASWPQLAEAATRVTFYSHDWGSGPNGEVFFPHAFIRLEGNPNGGPAIDRTYGFTTGTIAQAMGGHPGRIVPTEGDFMAQSQADFWIEISDAQYDLLMDRIAWWQTPEGSTYNIWTRSCIDFVADMATTLGLKPGNARTWKPAVFMKSTYRLNADRLRLPEASVPEAPDVTPSIAE